MRRRDKTLDVLRGVAILQVVFVHILYWMGIFNTGYQSLGKSWLLFEMPVFFFVTGSVNSLGEYYGYKSFVLKRLKGILIPYYFYAVICVIISFSYYVFKHEFVGRTWMTVFISWLVPIGAQRTPLPSYFVSALWFIPIYILTILLFPILKVACTKFGGGNYITFGRVIHSDRMDEYFYIKSY